MSLQQRWAPTASHARPRGHRSRGGGVLTGMALIVIGTLFLLHNLDVVDFDFSWHAWPLFLVLFGVVRLIERSDRSSGLWLIAIGLWLYVNENNVWDMDYSNSWPFLLVFGGLMMVGKALRGNDPSRAETAARNEEPPQDGGTR